MTKIPEMWKFRMASDDDYYDYDDQHDEFNPSPFNLSNFIVQFGLYFMFVHFHVWEWLSIILSLLFGLMWELKSGLIPYNNYNDSLARTNRYFGGWGFSYTQALYGFGGIFCAFLLDVMWPPAIRKPPQHEELEGEDDMTF